MTDNAIADEIKRLLRARAPTATICPSEVARALAPENAAAWRALMPQVRRVAAAMAATGLLRVTQRGMPVDANLAKGPIRLGRGLEG